MGFSLIELMVVSAILSALSLAFATMIVNQSKELKSVSEKLYIKDLETTIKKVMAASNYCSCIFRGRTFNAITNTWSGPFVRLPSHYTLAPPFPAPCTASTENLIPPDGVEFPGTEMTAEGLRLTDIVELTPGSGIYRANLEVGFENSVRKYSNLKSNFSFSVNTTTPPAARSFISCSTESASSPVTTRTANFSAPDQPFGSVNCLPSETLLAGGATCFAAAGWRWIVSSRPNGANGWFGHCDGEVNAGVDLSVWALCRQD